MRYLIYPHLKRDNNIDFYDVLFVDWNKFIFDPQTIEYTVTKMDCERPDLISFRHYGKADYLDILMLVNNIDHILELTPKTVLKIPPLASIQKFITKYRKF